MKEYESNGNLMPCEYIHRYLVRKMRELGWGKNIYLIDGYLKSKNMY